MWILIMLAMALATVLSIVYLTSRFYKFFFIKQIAGDKKVKRILLSFFPVILILGISWLSIGMP